MRKFWSALLAGLLIIPLLFQSQAQAAVKFTILIDGARLETSQAPVMIQGRVMLPMRAIFEALDAKVTWNQKTKTVTAVKDGTTIVLKTNAKTATINKQTVYLDVPAKVLKNTTMVPVRFVSESLGEKVGWNSKTKTVSITTSDDSGSLPDILYPVSYVSLKDVGNYGDGRDLQVNFSKSDTEYRAAQYRVMIVKASKSSSFNLSTAQRVPSSNYTVVFPSGSSPTVTLASNSRDVDGEYIRQNQAYTAYVLAVGKTGGEMELSSSSPSLTLTNTDAVESVTNVKATDVNDYNDGRDLSVSFTRAKNESGISNYRVIAVKTKDISRFDLAAAKAVASQNYTSVTKTSSSNTTLSTVLSSSSRDSSGEYIRNGIPYTLYVLSLSNNENTSASKLSSGSPSITLATGSNNAPVITQVTDISDYNDGRDLRVSFTKLSDESGIGAYRIFVVKSSDYQNFNLNRANNVSSYNYTQVNKTGYNITQVLSSGARDVDGATIRNGVNYRVFVMSVGSGNNSGNNKLSSPSNNIILNNNNANVGSISNLYVTDVSDNNDGRDLQVSFTRASDEYNITHYRAFVVKTNKANSFDLNDANSLSSYYYTQINKTGYNITQKLNSDSRDTDGDYIRNGVSYRVFILSVGSSNYSGNNALSAYSSTITLSNNRNVTAATNVTASDVNDYKDGRDLRVSFTKASDESNIGSYRAFVVKSDRASYFDLNDANSNYNYTQISKTGNNISQVLNSESRDTDGNKIQNGVSYRVFIMSVGSGNYSGSNALSSYSPVITLSSNLTLNPATITDVKDISDNDNGSDLQVKFNSSPDSSKISEYRILVVKSGKASNFDLTAANSARYYTTEYSQSGTITKALTKETRDTDGDLIKNDINYKVFVLAIGKDSLTGKTALSNASVEIRLTGNTKVDVVRDVTAEEADYLTKDRFILVSFTKAPDESRISHYQIYVVKESEAKNFTAADTGANFKPVNKTGSNINKFTSSTVDSQGAEIKDNEDYRVFVLSVSKDGIASNNALSVPSSTIKLEGPEISEPKNVKITANEDSFNVTFSASDKSKNVSEYRVMLVPEKSQTDKLETVTNFVTVNPGDPLHTLLVKDINDEALRKGTKYKAYVLAVNKFPSVGHKLSNASDELELLEPKPLAASLIKLKQANEPNKLNVSFNVAKEDSTITSYQVVFLPASSADSLNLKKTETSKSLLRTAVDVSTPSPDNSSPGTDTGTGTTPGTENQPETVKNYTIDLPSKDGNGADIQAGKAYKAVILSLVINSNKSTDIVAVSNPSKEIVLVASKAKR